MYRQMVTNEDGEPLGFDYHYDDEPSDDDGFDDYGPEDYEPDDEPDAPEDDEYGQYDDGGYADTVFGYEEYEPSPYDGTYSEE